MERLRRAEEEQRQKEMQGLAGGAALTGDKKVTADGVTVVAATAAAAGVPVPVPVPITTVPVPLLKRPIPAVELSAVMAKRTATATTRAATMTGLEVCTSKSRGGFLEPRIWIGGSGATFRRITHNRGPKSSQLCTCLPFPSLLCGSGV